MDNCGQYFSFAIARISIIVYCDKDLSHKGRHSRTFKEDEFEDAFNADDLDMPESPFSGLMTITFTWKVRDN